MRTTGHHQNELPTTARVFACQSSESKQSEQNESHSKRNELDTLLELGSYHYPLDLITPDFQNHGTNTIRALADMFTCKLSNLPLTVGIFTEQNDKEYLSRIATELRNISRLSGPLGLRFSFLLFLFPLALSTFLGYVVGMLTTWQVGLSIGHVGMFLQITFLVIVIIGSRVCHNQVATRISHSIAAFLRWLQLVLNVCFCYPTAALDAKAPVKTIIVYHRLWPSSTPNVALFSMVDKMWTGLMRMHGEIPIRLQRASKPSPQPNRRFKRVCCLPAFLVVLAFCIAFIVETGMIRLYSGQVALMLTDGGRIAIFVLSSSVLFLGLFGSLPSLYRLARSLTINPVQPLRTALAEFLSDEANEEEYNQLKPKGKYKCLSKPAAKLTEPLALGNSTSLKNLAITAEEERARRADILIKEEFAKLCKLSLTFDRFLSEQQTRFIICLDASETKQSDVLAKLIYQIHSLVLTESLAPVAFVLESNFKVLLGETATSVICPSNLGVPAGATPVNVPRTLSDNLHLVHTSIHLPIYLEPPLFTDVDCEQHRENDLTTISANVSANGMSRSPVSHSTNKEHSGITYTPKSIFGNRSSVAPLRSTREKFCGPSASSTQHLSLSRSSSTASRSVETCQGITGLFLRDHELADWNGKSMKQLVAATSFTSRLLRLCNLEVHVEEMILWITMVQYWPYHVAWLVVYLEGLIEGKAISTGRPLSNQTCVNLIESFKEVKSRVAASIEQLEPLVSDDRDLDRLDSYLRAKASKPITIGNLKKLISCVLMHNPFLRYCIRAQILNPDRQQCSEDRRTGQASYTPAVTSLVQEQRDQFRISSGHNANSVVVLPMSRTNSGKGRMAQLTANSLSGDSQTAHFFPCATDLITSAEETPKTSIRSKSKLPKFGRHLTLSQYTVSDVCNLISNISEIEAGHRYIYQTNIKERNMTGLVLYYMEPERLRHELNMTIPDWQVFCRAIHYLREQERLMREGLSETRIFPEAETDSGSLISPLVIKNKHPYVGTTHSLNSLSRNTKSSPISSITSSDHRTKQPTLVRQTPWLQSPQIPTSILNSEGLGQPTTDVAFTAADDRQNSENQASLSGMEEPESLWKPSSQSISSKTISKQKFAGDAMAKSFEEESTIKPSYESGEADIQSEALKLSRFDKDPNIGLMKPTKWISNLAYERNMVFDLPDSNINHDKTRSRLGHNDYRGCSSRSTVDLRTAFGPLSFNPQAAEICYREALRRKSRSRRRSSHKTQLGSKPDPRIFINQHGLEHTELMNMHKHEYNPPVSNEMIVGEISMQQKHPWKLENDESCDEMKDLRRMKKRPCRRSSKAGRPKYNVLVNKNAKEAELQMQVNAYGRKKPTEPPIVNDSESDSLIVNPTFVSSFIEPLPWTNIHPPRRDNRGHKLYRCPALNPAQVASLYSYVSHAGRVPAMTTPECDLSYALNPNEAEMKYSRKMYFQLSPTQFTETAESYKPSQKKRSRHTEFKQSQQNISSPRLAQSFLKPGHSMEHMSQIDYLDGGTNSPDSYGEECTCDYWYGIDRNGDKVAISEPTLRGDSDGLYSDDNTQICSLHHELPKRCSHGTTNGKYGIENGSC